MDMFEQYKNLIKAFADPCQGIIYHYTSAEGLRGIIENSEIWLTNVKFVNDTTEGRALQEKKTLFNDSDFTNIYVKKEWKEFVSSPYADNNTSYITSFSRGQESLDQWRAYGNFRIGFEASKLVKRHFNMYKCIYSDNQMKRWILQKENLKEWSNHLLNDEAKDWAAFNLIYAASKKYKNNYFKNEKEFRLVVVSNHNWDYPSPSMYENDPPLHYRDHPIYKFPIPYVKFYIEDNEELIRKQEEIPQALNKSMKERDYKEKKFKDDKSKRRSLLPIKDIFIGPMLHQKEAELACKILLSDKGYKNVEIDISKIPYRGF